MARPRPQIVSLTPAAVARVRAVMAATDKPFLRVGVKKGGCAGMEYVMDYADTQGPLDEVVDADGVKVLVDAKAVLFLIGSRIDFVEEALSQRFVFVNPNQTDACGCGESVTIVPGTELTETV